MRTQSAADLKMVRPSVFFSASRAGRQVRNV
jgi:hypothetical protein